MPRFEAPQRGGDRQVLRRVWLEEPSNRTLTKNQIPSLEGVLSFWHPGISELAQKAHPAIRSELGAGCWCFLGMFLGQSTCLRSLREFGVSRLTLSRYVSPFPMIAASTVTTTGHPQSVESVSTEQRLSCFCFWQRLSCFSICSNIVAEGHQDSRVPSVLIGENSAQWFCRQYAL